MPNLIEYVKGSAADEKEVIYAVKDFLLNVLDGWSLLDTVTDTGSDVDLVFYSRGTVPGRYRDLYVRWRGTSNNVYVYGYSYWISSVSYQAQIHNASQTMSSLGGGPFTYWIFGDNDGVWLLLKKGAYYYSLYTGYLESYYNDVDDDLPLCVIGQVSSSTTFTAADRMHTYTPGATGSGISMACRAASQVYSTLLNWGKPNQRDGSVAHFPLIFIRTTNVYEHEIRGEAKHLLWFPGDTLASEDWVTVSGTNYKYFIQKVSDANTFGFGPIPTTSGEW